MDTVADVQAGQIGHELLGNRTGAANNLDRVSNDIENAAALEAAGISEGMVRLSVGLEDIADLKDDLGRALKASQRG